MTFVFTLKISHKDLKDIVFHEDKVNTRSLSKALKRFALGNKQICELKNYGFTEWVDRNEAIHTLEVKTEAN